MSVYLGQMGVGHLISRSPVALCPDLGVKTELPDNGWGGKEFPDSLLDMAILAPGHTPLLAVQYPPIAALLLFLPSALMSTTCAWIRATLSTIPSLAAAFYNP